MVTGMASSTSISVRVLGLREFAMAMGRMGEVAFDRSQRKAVTFIAKDYHKFKKGKISTDVDRPAPFTKRGYDWDGASRSGSIQSRAFVRERQSEYMELMETGGIRRKFGKNGPVIPKPNVTDRFGGLYGAKGMRKRFLNRSATPSGVGSNGRPTYAVGAKVYRILTITDRRTGKQLHGVFEKRKMGARSARRLVRAGKNSWRTRLIILFQQQARYKPKLGFAKDAKTYARDRFPRLAWRLFNEELARQRGRAR